MTRFSKRTAGSLLWAKVHALERQWGFDRGNGYDQVTGRGEAINRAYGEYTALRELADQWEIREEATR